MRMTFAAACLLASPAVAQDAPPAFATPAIEADALGKITGRADVAQEIRANNSGTVTNNRITGDSVTGAIRFDGNAFDNMHGLSVLSANTGNNVAINSSLNVNVSLRP